MEQPEGPSRRYEFQPGIHVHIEVVPVSALCVRDDRYGLPIPYSPEALEIAAAIHRIREGRERVAAEHLATMLSAGKVRGQFWLARRHQEAAAGRDHLEADAERGSEPSTSVAGYLFLEDEAEPAQSYRFDADTQYGEEFARFVLACLSDAADIILPGQVT
ncbi:MAG TPA: hypothetical protein VKQ34_02405 [Candidatus Saccharimonadales bacterium]|nr:hypothetical protein [Candidatus Saccharimonadales bacterium]